jgi:biopolymer transport protein ExbD
MAHDGGFQGGPITGINVTPLVDITLVLLIVFMVTARLMNQREALEVDLPQAATGQSVPEIFNLVLPAAGGIELDGEKLADDDDLLASVRRALEKSADLRAVIQADAAVAHGRVMHVLDMLRQAGVSRIGFGVVPAPTSARPDE